MDQRTVVITGANAGIGRVTAIDMAKRGARVILAGRSEARTRPVLDAIRALGGPSEPGFVALDLGDLDSVRRAASEVLDLAPRIDVLINNAGLGRVKGLTKSGFEPAFGVNHVGHFLWTRLLLDRIRASAPARIVNVASRAHERAKGIDWEAVRKPLSSFTGMPEYQVSKLANVLFDQKLSRELEGSGVVTASLHPGVVATEIWRRVPQPLRWLMTRRMLTEEQGARTSIWCATAPELQERSGRYFDEHQNEKAINPVAAEHALQDELWRRSEAWTGLA